MANPEFFKQEFLKHAVNGFIGDPNGKPAFGYLRVSTIEQAEEGRSGLPRQIENIHVKAKQEGYKISWDMIFADDYSGFELEERPQIQKFLKEIRNKDKRRANALVIENMDRLGRKAWIQDYLYEQFEKLGVSLFSYIDVGSRIERSVKSAIAQDGMLENLRRMREGIIKKLESGRVTAKHPAYGYQFVDSNGDPNGKNVKRDTHYGILEHEAVVVRYIYEQIISGMSLRQIVNKLDLLYPPPKKCSRWEITTVSRIIKNEDYKGWFIGNKTKEIKVEQEKGKGKLTNEPPKMKKVQVLRDKEEWIWVPVPPIVSEDIWQLANDMMAKNAEMASRNAKREYLLTGLVKCATCGLSYIGKVSHTRNRPGGKRYSIPFYYCSSHVKTKVIRQALGCKQSMIPTHKLEDAIWEIVCSMMTDPTPMLKALDDIYHGESNETINSQIQHIRNKIASCDIEDARVIRGFRTGLFDEEEAKQQRNEIKDRKAELQTDLEKLEGKQMTQQEYLAQKELILELSAAFRAKKLDKDTPFALKRSIIKTVVDRIDLDVDNQCFDVSGIIKGSWSLADDIELHSATGR